MSLLCKYKRRKRMGDKRKREHASVKELKGDDERGTKELDK
jgi:hypothetical protein